MENEILGEWHLSLTGGIGLLLLGGGLSMVLLSLFYTQGRQLAPFESLVVGVIVALIGIGIIIFELVRKPTRI